MTRSEPERADEQTAVGDVDAPTPEEGEDDPERAEPQFAPGDCDLADAWWAL